MAIRILSSENITGDITTSGKVNAGDRILTEATTSNSLLQVRYNASNYLEAYYDTLNVVGGDFLIKRAGDTKIRLTAVGTTFTNLSNTSAASSSVDEVKIGTFGAGRPAIFLGSSNTTYTNSTWFIENIGASGKFRIGRNGLDIFEIENSGASTFKAPSVTVLNASDPSVAVSDTDTNYKGIMTWRNSGSENVLEFVTRYGGTYYTNNLVLDRGKVGIGTGSPGRKLTVTGDVSGDANNLLLSNENDTNGDSASIGFSMLSNNTYVKAGIFFQRITTQGRGDLIFANNNEVNGNNVGITNEIMSIRNTGAIEIKGTSTTLNGKAFITNTDALMTIGSTQSSGVPKDMAFFNGSTRMTIQATTGNVGINSTNPSFPVDVNGIIRSSTSSVGYLYLGNTAQGTIPGGAIIAQRSPSYSSTGKLLFQVPTWGANTDYGLTTQMSIDVKGSDTKEATISMIPFGGKVGIGTDSPGQKLAIEGSGTANENILRVNNQANVSSRIWLRNSAQSAYIFNSGSTPDTLATGILGQAFGMGIGNNSPIQFYNGVSASVKMTILPSGNVGIGRTQADEKLEVEGSIKAKDVDGKIYSMVASWSYVASKNDLFSYPGTDGAVWEYTIKMNPNSAGSGAYRDFYYGKLGVGIGWNGSNVTQYIWQQQDQTAPRTLYDSGGGNFNPLFRMYYSGGIYTELALNTAWTLRIQGLSTSTYGDIFFRRLA